MNFSADPGKYQNPLYLKGKTGFIDRNLMLFSYISIVNQTFKWIKQFLWWFDMDKKVFIDIV